MKLVLKGRTTDATPVELTLDGRAAHDGGSTGMTDLNARFEETNRADLPDNSVYTFSGIAVGKCMDGETLVSESFRFADGHILRGAGAGTTTFIMAPTKTSSPGANWDCDAEADAVNGALKFLATGEAGKAIDWTVSLDLEPR